MTPNDHPAHPLDELAGHALGILDPDVQRAVDAHLAQCEPCRIEESAFAETAWAVAEMSAREAPPTLRAAIVTRARDTGPAAPQRAGFFAALFRPVPVAFPLALAAILVVALAGYGGARRDADRYAAVVSAAVGAKVIPLTATVVAMRGSVVVPANGTTPYLILDLPPAPAGKTWEAWVTHPNADPLRAGLTSEVGLTTLELGAQLTAGDTVSITAEPLGGVDRPTGAMVLSGRT